MTTASIENIALVINDEAGGLEHPVFGDVVELEEDEYALIFPDNNSQEIPQEERDYDDSDAESVGASYLRAYIAHEWNVHSNRAALP